MKTVLNIFLLLIFIVALSNAQTSHRYYETFDSNNETGWAFLASDATISTQNGKMNFSSASDEIVQILPPIGATKNDFSIRAKSGANSPGGFGRMGFKSYIGIHIDDSLYVIYSANMGSYSNPNLTWLVSYPIPANVNSLQLDVSKSGNNLLIKAYVNDVVFYNGQINNADEGLLSGQIVTFLIKDNGPIEFWLDEVDIRYNPMIGTPGVFVDEFNNPHSPWFRFGDNDHVAQSVTINNGRLNFNYSGTSETWLYVIPPVGAVGNFSIEVEGGAGSSHNAPFSISRFFDYRNYTTMFFEDDTLYIGYASNSYEPTIVNRARFIGTSITKLKFSVEGNAPTLTLKVWANNLLVLTGTINNATARLAVGHIGLGYDRGNVVNSYLNYASINYTQFVTSINGRESIIFKRLCVISKLSESI